MMHNKPGSTKESDTCLYIFTTADDADNVKRYLKIFKNNTAVDRYSRHETHRKTQEKLICVTIIVTANLLFS